MSSPSPSRTPRDSFTILRAKILVLVISCLGFIFVYALRTGNAWFFSSQTKGEIGTILYAEIHNALLQTSAASTTPVSYFDPNTFAGYYSDPNHVNCQRVIQVAGHVAVVSGTDGNPACPPNGNGTMWTLPAHIVKDTILVDFSPKGGPADLVGVYNATTEPAGIQWPDGNKWTKIDEERKT